jgi:hypothetical protein
VTGHRTIAAAARTHQQVERTLDELAGPKDRSVPLVAVSSLAEGADRLVAQAVLARPDGRLVAVLPMEPSVYAEDFVDDASRAAFEALATAADEVVIVPTDPGDPTREAAYERAGRAVLDRCDVLLALWDGEPGRGRGGTAELVEEARRRGRRVIVIGVER